MAPLLRFFALCLLLHLSLPAISGNGIGKDELDAQKEWLLLKIDSGKELAQKDIEAQGKRLDALDKRIDDQVSRVSDIGNAVDRFSVVTGWIAILITGVLALGGLLGYLSVTKKAREEAEVVSEITSKKWFDDNHQTLSERIRDLENAVAQALEKIAHSVADVEMHRQSAINTIQNGITSGVDSNPKLSPEDEEGLRASVKQLKDKPEANYSFDDWNTRAFAAYQARQFEDAALFWKYAAEVPNAGAVNTAQALFNRAVTLSDLKRDDEAIVLYDQLIATYADDKTSALREQVARAMGSKAFRLGQKEKNEEATALYDQLIATYADDKTPALREQVGRAMLNKAVALGKMEKSEEAIALCEQLIATYANDKTPALCRQVAMAMNGNGFNYLMLAKKNWNTQEHALHSLMQAEQCLQTCLEKKAQWGMALGNLAYVQWLLQRPTDSEASFRTALKSKENGGDELYKLTLDDVAQYTIPEDVDFKEMVERLWAEYKGQPPEAN